MLSKPEIGCHKLFKFDIELVTHYWGHCVLRTYVYKQALLFASLWAKAPHDM